QVGLILVVRKDDPARPERRVERAASAVTHKGEVIAGAVAGPVGADRQHAAVVEGEEVGDGVETGPDDIGNRHAVAVRAAGGERRVERPVVHAAGDGQVGRGRRVGRGAAQGGRPGGNALAAGCGGG